MHSKQNSKKLNNKLKIQNIYLTSKKCLSLRLDYNSSDMDQLVQSAFEVSLHLSVAFSSASINACLMPPFSRAHKPAAVEPVVK